MKRLILLILVLVMLLSGCNVEVSEGTKGNGNTVYSGNATLTSGNALEICPFIIEGTGDITLNIKISKASGDFQFLFVDADGKETLIMDEKGKTDCSMEISGDGEGTCAFMFKTDSTANVSYKLTISFPDNVSFPETDTGDIESNQY